MNFILHSHGCFFRTNFRLGTLGRISTLVTLCSPEDITWGLMLLWPVVGGIVPKLERTKVILWGWIGRVADEEYVFWKWKERSHEFICFSGNVLHFLPRCLSTLSRLLQGSGKGRVSSAWTLWISYFVGSNQRLLSIVIINWPSILCLFLEASETVYVRQKRKLLLIPVIFRDFKKQFIFMVCFFKSKSSKYTLW